jgi:hypothetical protein
MTAFHVRDKTSPPPPVSGKDGEYYDRCPADGCIETEPHFRNGGVDGRRQEHLSWSMYNADQKKGGCGFNWARTTNQGIKEDQAKGVNPKWGTETARTGRSYSLPTEQFRMNYEDIDWSK